MLDNLLGELHESGRSHDAAQADRCAAARPRALAEGEGRARDRDVQRGSTLYLADAVRATGGLIAADNAISHEAEMAPFRALVEAHEGAVTALDETGAGLLLVTLI